MSECIHDMKGVLITPDKPIHIVDVNVKCLVCGEFYQWVNLEPMPKSFGVDLVTYSSGQLAVEGDRFKNAVMEQMNAWGFQFITVQKAQNQVDFFKSLDSARRYGNSVIFGDYKIMTVDKLDTDKLQLVEVV